MFSADKIIGQFAIGVEILRYFSNGDDFWPIISVGQGVHRVCDTWVLHSYNTSFMVKELKSISVLVVNDSPRTFEELSREFRASIWSIFFKFHVLKIIKTWPAFFVKNGQITSPENQSICLLSNSNQPIFFGTSINLSTPEPRSIRLLRNPDQFVYSGTPINSSTPEPRSIRLLRNSDLFVYSGTPINSSTTGTRIIAIIPESPQNVKRREWNTGSQLRSTGQVTRISHI